MELTCQKYVGINPFADKSDRGLGALYRFATRRTTRCIAVFVPFICNQFWGGRRTRGCSQGVDVTTAAAVSGFRFNEFSLEFMATKFPNRGRLRIPCNNCTRSRCRADMAKLS